MKHLQKYEPTTGRHYAEPMDSLEVPFWKRYHKPTFRYMTKREDKS